LTTQINSLASAGLAPELRTYYDRNLLQRLLPLAGLHHHGPGPADARATKGQSVQYRKFNSPSVATTPLTEGVTPGQRAADHVDDLGATPAQYGDWLQITDILDFTAPDPILTEFGQLLGGAGGTHDRYDRS
jgi:N4-gp56 family major capsid protein